MLIHAVVKRPNKNQVPWIEPVKESRPGWSSYRLAWGSAVGGMPRSAPDSTEVDYHDKDGPRSVKTLRIYLPGGREHIIESKRA